jgi:CubicO group peptidase (beta-lactamase class C family)
MEEIEMDTRELGLDSAQLDRAREVIAADIASERYDGAVVLVARHGQIVLHEAAGFAERSSGRPASTEDIFHLFSVTKAFTAVAVLRRVDRG